MSIVLKSDYHDCYDIWLAPAGTEGVCFSRIAEDSWSVHRSQMFELFDTLGLATPKCQAVRFFDPAELVVLYLDPFSHCGEGKTLLLAGEAVAAGHGDVLASEFVGDFKGLSYRYFVVAGEGAWFEHWSVDDWRSNCGDGDLATLTEGRGPLLDLAEIEAACRPLRNPVWAIDFVGRKTPGGVQLLAIDWNPAPRLAGTPARAILKQRFGGNQGMAEAISEAVCREAGRLGLDTLDNNKILLAG